MLLVQVIYTGFFAWFWLCRAKATCDCVSVTNISQTCAVGFIWTVLCQIAMLVLRFWTASDRAILFFVWFGGAAVIAFVGAARFVRGRRVWVKENTAINQVANRQARRAAGIV